MHVSSCFLPVWELWCTQDESIRWRMASPLISWYIIYESILYVPYIYIIIYRSSFASMFFILAVAHCVLILGQTILLKHPSIHISREAPRNTSFIEWCNSERTSNDHSWINNLHMFNLILTVNNEISPDFTCRSSLLHSSCSHFWFIWS